MFHDIISMSYRYSNMTIIVNLSQFVPLFRGVEPDLLSHHPCCQHVSAFGVNCTSLRIQSSNFMSQSHKQFFSTWFSKIWRTLWQINTRMTVFYHFTCLFVIINIHIPSPSVHDPKFPDKTYVICILSTIDLFITMTIAQLIHPKRVHPTSIITKQAWSSPLEVWNQFRLSYFVHFLVIKQILHR